MSLLSSRLQAEGYQVTRAVSVSEALRVTRNELPDLLILDLTLLDGDPFAGLTDGFAFLIMARRSHPEADFPVIVHTVDASPAVQARAKALGAVTVFQKGRPFAELLRVIRGALDERAQARIAASEACRTPNDHGAGGLEDPTRGFQPEI
ncbi:MAG: response regulator [Verrucomicrobia bacterium]|nr:response regulator [Verrucomicrobiota bacterium]